MCMYCERRTDIKFGWNQPKLPYHNQKDISATLSGNVLENEKWEGTIHDYQTACPQLILTSKNYFNGEGTGTIYIPIKCCPECGRKLGKTHINEFRGEYAFLSNFYSAPVVYDGLKYQNNEAAFQAAKTFGTQRERFTNISPSYAKKIGRHVPLRSDWEDVKFDVMYDIVKAKFTQNEDLKRKLLDTEGYYLEEGNNWGDKIWGVVNGVGENHLGKILMRVRNELKMEEYEISKCK